jgi:hypothetical protein
MGNIAMEHISNRIIEFGVATELTGGRLAEEY